MRRRDVVNYLVASHRLSSARACRAVGLSRSTYYEPLANWLERDREIIEAVLKLADEHRRWGFWKIYDRLHKDGCPWNHKRVYPVYGQLGLNHKRRGKRRVPARFREPLDTPPIPNCAWAMDFMEDRLYVGRRFRTLKALDEGVREGLRIEIDTSITGARAVRIMEQLGLCATCRQPFAVITGRN